MLQPKTIARPYAKAVFDFAVEQNDFAFWQAFLQNAALITDNEQIKKILGDPNISMASILELFYSVLGDTIDSFGKNFLQLLAEYNRLNILPEIVSVFVKLKNDYEKKIDVHITSAYELTDAQQEKITSALEKRLQRQINTHCKVDSSILGGAIIRAGDLVFDGSGRKQLEQLRYHLRGNF